MLFHEDDDDDDDDAKIRDYLLPKLTFTSLVNLSFLVDIRSIVITFLIVSSDS